MSGNKFSPWVDSTLNAHHRDLFKLLTVEFFSDLLVQIQMHSRISLQYVSGSTSVHMNQPDPEGCWFNYLSLCCVKNSFQRRTLQVPDVLL